MAGLTIRAGALTIHGQPPGSVRDFRGFGLSRMSGWDDSVGDRRDDVALGAGHGNFDVPGTAEGRLVIMDGFAIASSEAELEALRDELMGLCAGGSGVHLEVDRGGRPLWAWVRRGAKPTWEQLRGGNPRARWQLTFWAPDPRKYGSEAGPFTSIGENVLAWHDGNFPALPRFKVAGFPTGGYALYRVGGGTFKVEGNRPSGSIDRIDFRDGVVYRDGVPLAGVVTTGDLWELPPGVRTQWRVESLDGSSSGSAGMYPLHTYI